ncbi:hypothetical protein E1293_40850 [Actinomadura darangshiensis]|uniref:Uncharacterized protein n=1 Tax=Actinomadura darangshiensis TaxID=705336 RepID=A0A4R4ZZX0_9ACTN|nr:hypothetical protein [Actinomadura darangshiensis]TDD64983.1 hypothetical protein E1293_40850 [Actinomadura darangshiensis]
MTKFTTAFMVGTTAFLVFSGCGGNDKEAGRTGAGEETIGQSPAQTSTSTFSGEVLPTLEVGKPLPVNLSNSGTDEASTASEEFTLKKIDRFKSYTEGSQTRHSDPTTASSFASCSISGTWARLRATPTPLHTG